MKQFSINMKTIKIAIFSLFALVLLNSCGEDEPIVEPKGVYENGFFVLNEGIMTQGNASITYISNDINNIEQSVFKGVNGINLGDVAQSMFTHEDKAYIIVNNSDKVEVVNRYTMEKITTIQSAEIKNPRYMVEYDGKGYLSTWGVPENESDDKIIIIDLATDNIIGSIEIGFVPNEMVVVGNKLYVEIQGWYSVFTENKIDVVNLDNNTVVKTIEVGAFPNAIVAYANDVYVLSTNRLDVISTSTDAITKTLNFLEFDYPSHLTNNGNDFYYTIGTNVLKWNNAEENLPTDNEFEIGKNIYNLTIKDEMLYVNHFEDYATAESKLNIYNLSTKELVHENIETGLYSNSVIFN